MLTSYCRWTIHQTFRNLPVGLSRTVRTQYFDLEVGLAIPIRKAIEQHSICGKNLVIKYKK